MNGELLLYSKILNYERRTDYRGWEIHAIIGDKDIRENRTLQDLLREAQAMKYYDLPKDDRWMPDGWNPDDIGGHYTDVSQIAWSLEHRVKELFPINCVPEEIAVTLKHLKESLINAEKYIQNTIEMITDYVAKEKAGIL